MFICLFVIIKIYKNLYLRCLLLNTDDSLLIYHTEMKACGDLVKDNRMILNSIKIFNGDMIIILKVIIY